MQLGGQEAEKERMREEVGGGQATEACAWLWHSELFLWVRRLPGCFKLLQYPTSHINPLKSLSSGSARYKISHFLVKAAIREVDMPHRARGRAVVVQCIRVLPCLSAKTLKEEK